MKTNITSEQVDKSYSELLPIPKGWRRLRQNQTLKKGDKMQFLGRWRSAGYTVGDLVRFAHFIRKIKTKSK